MIIGKMDVDKEIRHATAKLKAKIDGHLVVAARHGEKHAIAAQIMTSHPDLMLEARMVEISLYDCNGNHIGGLYEPV